jgi:hypothetical protein
LLETQLLNAIHHPFLLKFRWLIASDGFPRLLLIRGYDQSLCRTLARPNTQPTKKQATKAGEQTQSTIAQETLRCNALRAYSAIANYGQVNAKPNHSYYIRAFILVKILPLSFVFSLPFNF